MKTSCSKILREDRGPSSTRCEYLPAEHIVTNSEPKTRGDGGIHKALWGAVGGGNPEIDSSKHGKMLIKLSISLLGGRLG